MKNNLFSKVDQEILDCLKTNRLRLFFLLGSSSIAKISTLIVPLLIGDFINQLLNLTPDLFLNKFGFFSLKIVFIFVVQMITRYFSSLQSVSLTLRLANELNIRSLKKIEGATGVSLQSINKETTSFKILSDSHNIIEFYLNSCIELVTLFFFSRCMHLYFNHSFSCNTIFSHFVIDLFFTTI